MTASSYFNFLFCIWLILILSIPCIVYVTASPVSSDLSELQTSKAATNTITSVVGIVIGMASVLCLIVTLVVCLCNCFSKPTESTNPTTRNGIPMSPTINSSFESTGSREFTMFPPAGSSGYTGGPDDVYFEPLPDLNSINQVKTKSVKGDKPRPVMFSHVVGRNISFQDWFEDPYANFPRLRLQYVVELGSGWFGQVVEGEAVNIIPNEKKTKVVVKILMTGANTTDQIYFLHEVKPFRDTSHPNVLKLLGKCLESDPFLIILEHCVFGDLKNYLIKHRSESESLLRRNFLVRMAWEVSSGLQYLHSRGFIITDLAARNCLVTSDLVVKIGDYGNSIEKFKEDYYCAGGIAVPVRWCAPETLRCTETVMETKEVTVEANVWSFGVVVWEIFEFGKMPYFELNDDDLIQRVIIERNETLKRPLTPCRHLDYIYHLIQLCHLDANKRPAMSVLNDMLETLFRSDENDDAEADFENRWTKLHSPTFHENFNSLSSTTLLQLEDAPLSLPDLSLNFSDVIQNSDENEELRGQTGEFDVDDASWKRILESSKKESGQIIKMIQEKSQSVQDLMKLTVIDIESGSESDAPGVNSEESSEDSLIAIENNVQKIENDGPVVPEIIINPASSVSTVESSDNQYNFYGQPNDSLPAITFEINLNGIENESICEDTFNSDELKSSCEAKRRTSTPFKKDGPIVVEHNRDTNHSSDNTLDLFFRDPQLPTLSTISNATSNSRQATNTSDKSSPDLTCDLESKVIQEMTSPKSLDEGLELSDGDDSSYSLLTAATNRSDEEDCILMVDLETNKAVLVDVPTSSWEEIKSDKNQPREFLNDEIDGSVLQVERVAQVEEEEEQSVAEDESSIQLVVSDSSPILLDVKHDVEIVRGESPEWEVSTESMSSICTSPSGISSSSSGEFDCSTNIPKDHFNLTSVVVKAAKSADDISNEPQLFRLSTWNKDAVPTKSVLRLYNRLYLNEGKKTVSFRVPSEYPIYEYPKEEEETDDNDNYNSMTDDIDEDYENAYYGFHNPPSWSYSYDDHIEDYSTIADWDLGAEEMPELEGIDEYDDEEEIEREAASNKRQRSTWGAIYKLSDLPYEEEEIDEDSELNDATLNGSESFDMSYLPHNAYFPDDYVSFETDIGDITSMPEENDEDYWLQKIISTEDLIENTKCPFDLLDDIEDDGETDDATGELDTWNLSDVPEKNYEKYASDKV